MVRRQDGRFDAFRLSAEGGVLEGTLDVGSLHRLADRLVEGPGTIDWRIRGTRDREGRPALAVELSGSVPLECQRCLGMLVWPVEQKTELLLARSERELVDLDAASDSEVALADAPLDPEELVEDELLLTLPFAPMHENECPPGATGGE